MAIFMGLLGMLAGSGINWLACTLPSRRAAQAAPACMPSWALLKLVKRRPLDSADRMRLAVELVGAALFIIAWARFGADWRLLYALIVISFLLLVAVIDIQYRLVLNVMTYPAILIALAVQLYLGIQPTANIILGGLFAFIIFFGTAVLKPGQLGGGDVKLAVLIGVAFGFPGVIWALIIGAGAGALVSVGLLLSRQGTRATSIPYAPFLCLGAMFALLYGWSLLPA